MDIKGRGESGVPRTIQSFTRFSLVSPINATQFTRKYTIEPIRAAAVAAAAAKYANSINGRPNVHIMFR